MFRLILVTIGQLIIAMQLSFGLLFIMVGFCLLASTPTLLPTLLILVLYSGLLSFALYYFGMKLDEIYKRK